MIVPNQLAKAQTELKGLDLQGFTIPAKIQNAEGLYYVCIGVKETKRVNALGSNYSAKLLYAMPSLWQEMEREAKSGRVPDLFNGVFNKIVILNNPTLAAVKESKPEPKVKDLSPKQKKAVNELMESGLGEDEAGLKEVAKEVNISLDRLKAYIKSF